MITGGSAGIGLALAQEFHKQGNQVLITGRNLSKLEAAQQSNPAFQILPCDAADPDAIASLAETVQSQHADLNVLVNNAGTFQLKNLTGRAVDLTSLTEEVEVNVSGPIRTVSALVDTIKSNQGTIINVSSGLAYVPLQAAPAAGATDGRGVWCVFVLSTLYTKEKPLENQGFSMVL